MGDYDGIKAGGWEFCGGAGCKGDPPSPPELKWISGFFYWLNSVQSYQADDGWNYLGELKKWSDAGMDTSDTSFIDGASGIVNRGCYNPPACGTGQLDGGEFRAANFKKVLTAMKFSGVMSEVEVTV